MAISCVLRKPGPEGQCQILEKSIRACPFSNICIVARQPIEPVNWRTARAALSVLCLPMKALVSLHVRYAEQVLRCGYAPHVRICDSTT